MEYNKRIRRLERKCEKVLKEVSRLKTIVERSLRADSLIEDIHGCALSMREQSRRERRQVMKVLSKIKL